VTISVYEYMLVIRYPLLVNETHSNVTVTGYVTHYRTVRQAGWMFI
jgi:hypothetical protein